MFRCPSGSPTTTTASAPVTAVLAGLLTKVGRLLDHPHRDPAVPDRQINGLLMWVALLTMLVGILGALAQINIKHILSFTLISHIGYMIFGIAVGARPRPWRPSSASPPRRHPDQPVPGGGLIERRGGSTNVDRLAGNAAGSPPLLGVYLIPALNLGGIPPFSGFLGKVGLLEAGIASGAWLDYLLVGVSVLVSLLTLLTLLALIRVWNRVFLRRVEDASARIRAAATTAQGHHPHSSRVVTGDPGSVLAGSSEVVSAARAMVAAALVVVGVALTVFGPLLDLAGRREPGAPGPLRRRRAGPRGPRAA
ncbi:proton-conducting transporter membrane subunit [Kocuria rhizophila]|nr:proton-conducting transporter membrane subunit [Kocuria rhizophila]